jgi:hypothetical protein
MRAPRSAVKNAGRCNTAQASTRQDLAHVILAVHFIPQGSREGYAISATWERGVCYTGRTVAQCPPSRYTFSPTCASCAFSARNRAADARPSPAG